MSSWPLWLSLCCSCSTLRVRVRPRTGQFSSFTSSCRTLDARSSTQERASFRIRQSASSGPPSNSVARLRSHHRRVRRSSTLRRQRRSLRVRTRKCSKCQQVKNFQDFGPDGQRTRSACRSCERDRQNKARRGIPKKHTAKSRKGDLSYSKRYRVKHPHRALYGHAKARAKQKNLPFDLTIEYVEDLFRERTCSLTGLSFTYPVNGARVPRSPSLDRIVPRLGYVQGNVRPVLLALNCGMNSWGFEPLLEIFKEYLK